MRYLLDTNVVSALRVRGRHPDVERWASSIPVVDQCVAALTIAEIERSIVGKEREHPAQGAVLRRWLEDHVLPAFAERVVPFDLTAARILATYRVPEHAPFDDAVIAATAQACGAVVATRNTEHFAPLDIETVDPWDPATWR